MQYVGNKSKIADDILEIILKDAKPGQYYVEPFVGSATVIKRVPSTFKRIGADKNPYLIGLHKAIQNGWVPPTSVTEEEYDAIKKSMNSFPKELVAFVGFCCAFGGKFFGTYARNKVGVNDPVYFAERGSRGLVKDAQLLQGIDFRCSSYIELAVPDDAIVYCDPPYESTTGYAYKVNNFAEFWNWCENLVNTGRKVFVSGYSKPVNWDIVWEKQVKCSINGQHFNKKDELGRVVDLKKDRVERLFTRSPR